MKPSVLSRPFFRRDETVLAPQHWPVQCAVVGAMSCMLGLVHLGQPTSVGSCREQQGLRQAHANHSAGKGQKGEQTGSCTFLRI